MARDQRKRTSAFGTSGSNALDEKRSEDILRQAHEQHKRRALEKRETGGLSLRAAEHTGQKTISMRERRQWTLAAVAVIIAAVMATAMMLRHVEVAKVSIQNGRSRDHLAELNTQIDQLKMKIALAEDVKIVGNRATQKGMGYPGGDKVIPIALPDLPEETTPTDDASGDDNFLTAVLRAIGRGSD